LKLSFIRLLMLAALTVAAPLAAQQIDAPEPQWQSSTPAATAFNTPQQPTNAPQVDQPERGAPAAGEANGPAGTEHPRRMFRACAPSLTIVNPGADESPLSVPNKFKIFYRYSYDPCRIAGAAFEAGINQARDEPHEYGQGAEGYGKRVGKNLADTNTSTFFARFLLPSLLHDDPRYFRIGASGATKRRLEHAIVSPEWTRRDNGTHRFNYSRVLGDLIASAIGNAYRPEDDRTAANTFRRTGIWLGTASGSAVFEEFWPDIRARLFKKHKQQPAP
jgi:hypothetical protein